MANIIDVVMRLTDRVTEPLRNMRRQMEQTANMNRRLGRDIQNIGRGVSSIGESMMPAAAAITAVGVAAGKTFMDFEATITGAAVKAGATAEEMQKMRDVAGKLGAEFPITASQAAEGMDRLAAGGFNANETIGAMPGIITAAVASGEDLAVTSDVITSALSIWNLKNGDIAENTTHVADVVQMAANQSKLGMQDFGLAMQYAGAPAAALGVSIEELGTAMAIMSNNGIQASTIGTSLRSVMSRLAAPPKDAAMAIEQLGLKVNDANGKFVGMENIVGQMRTAMAGLSDTEQVAMAKAIAGEDAYSGLLALIKTSPEAYANMTNALQNAKGSSADAYAAMQKTLKGSIDAMMGSIEAFGIAMGTVMSPYIREAAETVKYFANVLTDMGPEQQKMLAMVAGGVVGFTAFALAAGKLITIGGALVTMYGEIGVVAHGGHIGNKLLEYSVRGVQAAYSGLGSIVTQSMTAMSSAGTTAGSMFETVKQKAMALRNLTWADIGTSISTTFSNARASVATSMANMRTSVGNGLSAMRARAVSAAASMRAFAASLSISDMASRAAGGIRAVGMSFLSAARAGLVFAVSPIGIAMIAIAAAAYLIYKNWDKVGPFFTSLWNRIKAAFAAAMQSIKPQIDRLKAAFDVLRNTVGTAVIAAFERLKAGFETVRSAIIQNEGTIHKIISALATVATVIGGVVVGSLAVLANIFTGVVTAAIGAAAAIISGFIQVLTGVVTFITGVFTGDWNAAWNGIKDIFAGVFNAISGICISVMDGIKSSVSGAIDSVKSLLGMANGASVTVTTSEVKANAEGGIYPQGAFLTTFAEKSPEAAIPINHTARAVSLWRQTGELLGVMPKQQPANVSIEQAPVDMSAGFRMLADTVGGGAVTNNQTVINQVARGSQQGTAPAPNKSSVSGAIDSVKSLLVMANGASVTVTTSEVKANAEGGIYPQGAFLTTFAEKSPEAAIPINHTARAVSLWRQTGELLGVMPKQQPANVSIEQAPVDMSAGFRMLADTVGGGAVTNNQTVINQVTRGSQQGTAPAPNRTQDINISVNMGGVTIKNDDGKDLKTMGRELASEILYNIQKHAVNANVGAV